MKENEKEIVTAFVMLNEKITNSKTNVLNFGSPEMTFYRGEIHMIKIIGDFPGIHGAELARKLGVTRAVVHRTIGILEKRNLIVKEHGEGDRKKFTLFLSESGQDAYRYHEAYHEQHDKALFDYLRDLSDKELRAIKGFLDQATRLIEHHA